MAVKNIVVILCLLVACCAAVLDSSAKEGQCGVLANLEESFWDSAVAPSVLYGGAMTLQGGQSVPGAECHFRGKGGKNAQMQPFQAVFKGRFIGCRAAECCNRCNVGENLRARSADRYVFALHKLII